MLYDDLTSGLALMNTRLTIRQDDHAIALQMRSERLAKPGGRPRTLGGELDLGGV